MPQNVFIWYLSLGWNWNLEKNICIVLVVYLKINLFVMDLIKERHLRLVYLSQKIKSFQYFAYANKTIKKQDHTAMETTMILIGEDNSMNFNEIFFLLSFST